MLSRCAGHSGPCRGNAQNPLPVTGMIHPQTAFIVVGLLFVAMPATAWTILHDRHDRQTVALWCAGGLLYGLGFILVGLRDFIPPWLTFPVANALAFAGYPLRLGALQRESGRPVPARAMLAAWLAVSALYLAIYLHTSIEAPRLALAVSWHFGGAALLAMAAWRLRRQRGFRSAGMVALAFAVFAAALVGRLVTIGLDWSGARAMPGSVDFAVAFVAATVAALYGNLGFIGIALEAAREAELARTSEAAREQEQRRQTELRVAEQQAHLAERERLVAAREELLTTMAYEVRQPLANAAAALEAASRLTREEGGQFSAMALPITRAVSVLGKVAAKLNNTLADAVLLDGARLLEREDVEVDVLVSLAIGDTDPNERGRIRCERSSSTRTAAMNLPLVRLALRNVIDNALKYSPNAATVVINVADSDTPLALIVEVTDQGDGIPVEVMAHLFERGVSGSSEPTHARVGLGLYVAHRVMQMHGGKVCVERGHPSGQTVSLVITQ